MSYRYGEPLTEEERQARHYSLTGGEVTPPPRGTGRAISPSNPGPVKAAVESNTLFWITILAHLGLLGVELWIARKQGWI